MKILPGRLGTVLVALRGDARGLTPEEMDKVGDALSVTEVPDKPSRLLAQIDKLIDEEVARR